MNNYEILNRLGGGSFADVYKAIEKKTGEYVAIKILKKKYANWEECLELRECKSLKKLQDSSLNSHQKGIQNIIKLKEMIFIKETGTLNLIFEYMEKDLFILMKERTPKKLNENQIRSIIYQTLNGLSYMHKYGFFHRDLKPENLLVTGEIIKIADFGLAREIRSIPPYTEYVSTRYYRAPECILKSTNYNSPIDIWALGCIMAEMYLHPQPLFCGNNEREVLYKICSILGTPNHESWNEGIQQANKMDIKFPKFESQKLESVIPMASKDAIDLISQMIKWDPNKRATASNLLQHKFFNNINNLMFISNDFNGSNLLISSIKGNKLSIQTKDDIPSNLLKKEDEINFSKILNDTEGFDNLLNKYDEDLEISTVNNNRNLISSPINGDRDFDFDAFRENAPTLTQNTLFLGNSTVFKGDSSSIMNKNITHITGINNNNKNDTIIDYNEKKIFDASVINNINSGITMTSIVQNNSNIHDGNEQILTSIENDGNILPIDEKDFSTNNLSKIENSELNFENAKPLKNNIIGSNKRRSARQFIEDSQKVGTDYMNIPKKDKENENVQNKPLIKNKFENNDIKFKEKDFNFQSRRAKPNTNNNTNNKNKQIHLSKLLEDKTIEKKNNNNNNNNNNIGGGFLFGMESRRGHNNNNQNNKNHPVKKVK
jgi:serine/threonine protein kinase